MLQTKPTVLTASQVMPFTVVGLNYKKADAHIRGLFSLDQSSKINLIKAAAEKGWLDHDQIVLESLMAFKRAGTKIIATYFAKDAVKLLS